MMGRIVVCATVALLVISCADTRRAAPGDVPELALTALPLIQPEPPFGRVADLEIGSDGSVFVLDGLSRTVTVFDHEGTVLRTFGGRGQGPGEFEQPAHLTWGPNGNLWALDLRNGRLTVFEPEGDLVSTHRPANVPLVFPFALGFSGTDTLRWVGITSPDPADPSAAWIETRVSGNEVIPIAQMDLPFVEWPSLFEHQTADLAMVLPVPFSGEPRFGYDPSGRLWYAHTRDPVVHRWATSGTIDLTIRPEMTPRPVTPADREEALAEPEFDELRSRLGAAGVAEMSSMIPDTKPSLAGFFFDDEGNIWIMRAAGGTERIIDIYDANGTSVATAHAPVAAAPRPRVRNGLLAAVVRDSLDAESLALYRIDR